MKAKLSIILIIILSIALVLAGCGGTTAVPEIGDKAPDFTLKTTSGESRSLSNFSGKPVLIIFEGIPCPQCDKQRPYIQEALKLSHESVTVLTIYRWNTVKVVQDYIEEKNLEGFSIALADKDDIVAPKYGFGNATTLNILIDADGTLLEKQTGPFTSRQVVESWLKSL